VLLEKLLRAASFKTFSLTQNVLRPFEIRIYYNVSKNEMKINPKDKFAKCER